MSREDLEADDDEDQEEEEEEEGDEEESEEGRGSEEEGSSSSNYEDALEKFDDPDTIDLEADQKGHEDDEIDSDEVVGESGDERFKQLVLRGKKKNKHAKRPTAADFMESDSGEEEEEEEDDDEMGDSAGEIDDDEDLSDGSEIGGFIDDEAEESDDGESDSSSEEHGLSDEGSDGEEGEDDDEDDDEEPTGARKKPKRPKSSGITASIKEMMGEQSVVRSLRKTVDADVQKGRAVQRQRKGFDALLNIRIRLQKSVSQPRTYATTRPC